MTNDFQIFGESTDGGGEDSAHSDVALITAYLARELSLVQIAAVEQRLATDREFRAVVQPVIDAWSLPGVLATSKQPPAARAARLSREQLNDGWERYQREALAPSTGAKSAQPVPNETLIRRRNTIVRIAAAVTLIVAPVVVAAQLIVYAANNPSAPGHKAARALIPSAWREADSNGPDDGTNIDPRIQFNDGPVQIAMVGASAQNTQAIPITDLAPPSARSSQKFKGILGVHETPDGKLLVNDAPKHQIWLLEKSFAGATIVVDSAPGSARTYPNGNVLRPFVPFLGDSVLFQDVVPRQFILMDPFGQIARSVAVVSPTDIFAAHHRGSGVDAKGRLIYVGPARGTFMSAGVVNGPPPVVVPYSASLIPPRAPRAGGTGGGRGGNNAPPVNGIQVMIPPPDTVPIHRSDFVTRITDTVGFLRQPEDMGDRADPGDTYGGGKFVLIYNKDSVAIGVKQVLNPLYTMDEFAVLSDGTIALVRGNDYHVDWIHPDGTKSSSGKLPFDWKRVSDEEKKRLADSAKADVDSMEAWAIRRENGTPAPKDSIPAVDSMRKATGSSMCGSPGLNVIQCPPDRHKWPYEVVSLSEMADYQPPFRRGAALADKDGNLWILPRTTTQSKAGELVYDVVHPKQGFLYRVRLPLGRSIAGFGKGGVVFLQFGDLKNGFILERSNVVRPRGR